MRATFARQRGAAANATAQSRASAVDRIALCLEQETPNEHVPPHKPTYKSPVL